MKHCKYQPEEGDFMYQPPWYGQAYATLREYHPYTAGIASFAPSLPARVKS